MFQTYVIGRSSENLLGSEKRSCDSEARPCDSESWSCDSTILVTSDTEPWSVLEREREREHM